MADNENSRGDKMPGKRPARVKPARTATGGGGGNAGGRGPGGPAGRGGRGNGAAPKQAATPSQASEHVETAKGWMESFKVYLRQVRAEFKRITWPNREQLRAFTLVVIATLVAVTLYLWVVSRGFDAIFQRLSGS